MTVARPVRELPAPQRIHHTRNLLWWMLLLVLGFVSYLAETTFTHTDDQPVLPTGNEREAFLAVTFGKIAEQGTDVILAATFEQQIKALRGAGYTAIGLDSLEAFYTSGRPLPDRPIVLLFDNVQRDSIEIADRVLAEANYRGVAFADVDSIEAGNIDLVSRHRLEQLADSDRWDIGVAACPPVDPAKEQAEEEAAKTGSAKPAAQTPDLSPAATTSSFRRARERVEAWTGQPVRAIDCERALDADGSAVWRQALVDAQYRFGIVLANPRLNYVDDSTSELRRVRVAKEWSAEDLLTTLAARMPRREQFVDAFDESAPKPDWIAERTELSMEKGAMRITAREGTSGGILFLGGSDRWSDGEAKVTVAGPPDGQFWISLRSTPSAAVRLGVSHGRVVIQKTEKGETHDYGNRAMPERSFVLGLTVSGGRATATVDGETLGDRPVEMPEASERGPLSIAVWDSDGKASVVLKRVEARPLQAHCAIIAATPSEGVWEELRRRTGDYAALSPRYFAWKEGRGVTNGGDAALSIFARHHRLRFLPAVDLDLRSTRPDYAMIVTQLGRWAREPGFDGLNLVVRSEVATNTLFRNMVYDLRKSLHDDGRSIAVTVAEQKGQLPADLRRFGNLYVIDTAASGGLETAIAPITLVGAPAG